jgi:hypothetical protein
MGRWRRERPLVYVLIAIAVITFLIGVAYLVMAPKDLPSFLPGHVAAHRAAHRAVFGAVVAAKSTAHESRRAAIAFVASAAIFLVAVSQSWTWRRWRHYH